MQHEKGELRWIRGRGPFGFESFPRRYYPDRVLGYFSAPLLWSTPVSIVRLKHSLTGACNWAGMFSLVASPVSSADNCRARRLQSTQPRPMPALASRKRDPQSWPRKAHQASPSVPAPIPDEQGIAPSGDKIGQRRGTHSGRSARQWLQSLPALMPRGRAEKFESHPTAHAAMRSTRRAPRPAIPWKGSSRAHRKLRPARGGKRAHPCAAQPDGSSRGRHSRRRASVASMNWASSCDRPVEQALISTSTTPTNPRGSKKRAEARERDERCFHRGA